MPRERLSHLGPHSDQVCLRLPCFSEDFLLNRAEGHAKRNFAPVLAFRRHELFHLLKVDQTYSLHLFLGVSMGLFNHVERSESRIMLLGQREGVLRCPLGTASKVSCEQDVLQT